METKSLSQKRFTEQQLPESGKDMDEEEELERELMRTGVQLGRKSNFQQSVTWVGQLGRQKVVVYSKTASGDESECPQQKEVTNVLSDKY